jgi:lipoprotein-releasing system permease protein
VPLLSRGQPASRRVDPRTTGRAGASRIVRAAAVSFELLIAWSHLRSRRQDAGVSLIAVLSVLGVTLGVQMLIIVLSVMAGFEVDLRDKILGSSAHMVVLSYDGPIADADPVIPQIEAVPGVVAASPFTYTEVMLRSSFGTSGAVLKGFDPARTPKVTGLPEDLKIGPQGPFVDLDARLTLLRELRAPPPALAQDIGDTEPLPGILLGEGLADTLKVFPGDRVHVINPIGGGVGPMGMPVPQVKAFRVAGIFYTGMYEYDTKWSYVDNADAQAFMNMGTSVTGIEVRVETDRLYDVVELSQQVEETLHYPLYTRNWLTMNASLFSALKLEKYVMGLILAQIITVAAVGIVTNLIVMVVTRAREISILKAMGASARMVRLIFVIEGAIVGVVGTALGTALGLLGCWALDRYRFPLDTNVYYLDSLPVVVEWQSVVSVVVAALVICFLATLYPAGRAAKLDPVEGLRYE